MSIETPIATQQTILFFYIFLCTTDNKPEESTKCPLILNRDFSESFNLSVCL